MFMLLWHVLSGRQRPTVGQKNARSRLLVVGVGDLEKYSVVGVQGPRADVPESACSLYYYEQTPGHFPALKIKNILEFSDLVLIHFVPDFQKKI